MQRMERRATTDARTMMRRSVASPFAAPRLFHRVSSSVIATSPIRAIHLPIISILTSFVSLLSVVLLLSRPVVLVEGITGR